MPTLLAEAGLHAAQLALLLSIPFVVAGLAASVLSGVISAVFGADDPSIQQFPRLALVGGAVVLLGAAVGRVVVGFAREIFGLIGGG